MSAPAAPSSRAALGQAILVAAIAVAVAGGTALVLADASVPVAGVPLPLAAAVLGFAINWLAFVPAALFASERFYDLTGSLCYLSVVAIAITGAAAAGVLDVPRAILGAAVAIWALRLGLFLVLRIRRAGKDGRFDQMKQAPARFFIAWTLQGLWVYLTSLSALIQIGDRRPHSAGVAFVAGAALFSLGFAIEVIADAQKAAFRRDPAQRGRFLSTGLWAWSRHPNYFGEILLWTGICLAGAGGYVGAQWLALLSPAFVAVLLLYVSGVPLLERRAEERWGGDPGYQAYKARTPLLLLSPPRQP